MSDAENSQPQTRSSLTELATGSKDSGASGSPWAKMASAVDVGKREASEPLLSQGEIDQFMKGGAAASQGGNQGVEALAEPGSISISGLPLLKTVADTLVHSLSQDIRQLTASIVGSELGELTGVRMGSFLDSRPIPSLLAIIKSELWPGFGLITADLPFASAFFDILMGGRQSRSGTVKMSRPFSAIELKFFRRLVEVATASFSRAFTQLVPTSFVIDRFETNPRLIAISPASENAARFRIQVQFGSRSGNIDFVLPLSTLEPIASSLRPPQLSADALVDPAWRRHFVDRIGRFEASIDVVLRELKLPFRTVVGLSVGDTIPLNMRPDTPVIIRCRGMPISTGLMARSGDRIAISLIDAPRNLKKEGKIFS